MKTARRCMFFAVNNIRIAMDYYRRGVPPWAPLLAALRGAHGGTPLQFASFVWLFPAQGAQSGGWRTISPYGEKGRVVSGLVGPKMTSVGRPRAGAMWAGPVSLVTKRST